MQGAVWSLQSHGTTIAARDRWTTGGWGAHGATTGRGGGTAGTILIHIPKSPTVVWQNPHGSAPAICICMAAAPVIPTPLLCSCAGLWNACGMLLSRRSLLEKCAPLQALPCAPLQALQCPTREVPCHLAAARCSPARMPHWALGLPVRALPCPEGYSPPTRTGGGGGCMFCGCGARGTGMMW